MNPMRDRFNKDVDKSVEKYTSSISYDKRLYKQDIAGSIAHARMLAKQGIISDKDAERIVMALTSIREEIESGSLALRDDLEDIHMNIEARLIEKIGDEGRKLHTARSRNDQVALDMRLFVKEAISQTIVGPPGITKRSSRCCGGEQGRNHTGLYPPATGAAGAFRPSLAGLFRDAPARCGAVP